MAEILHQLRLVISLSTVIYEVSKTSKKWLGMGVLNHQEYHIYIYIENRHILYIRTYIRACQIPVAVGTYSSFHHYFNFGTFFIKHHNFHSEPGQKPTYIHMAYRTSGNGQEPTYIHMAYTHLSIHPYAY